MAKNMKLDLTGGQRPDTTIYGLFTDENNVWYYKTMTLKDLRMMQLFGKNLPKGHFIAGHAATEQEAVAICGDRNKDI